MTTATAPVIIAGQQFKSPGRAAAATRAILAKYGSKALPNQITQPEDIDFLRDIASRHPDPALSAEIAWFEVRWHDDGGRGFTAIRQDGTAVEWNFYPVFMQHCTCSLPARPSMPQAPRLKTMHEYPCQGGPLHGTVRQT